MLQDDLIMMKSKELSLYLQGKLKPHEIRDKIYQSIKYYRENSVTHGQFYELEPPLVRVTGVQLMNLLNDYINGIISKYEFFYILTHIDQNKDILVDNPAAIELLFQLVSGKNKFPLGIAYIKSMIYRP